MKSDTLPTSKLGDRSEGTQVLDQIIGGRVAALRARQAFTRGELAARTGMAECELLEFELGLAEIPPPIIYALSRALGVPMRRFFKANRGTAQ